MLALVLLIWTAVDLCIPMVCPSEGPSTVMDGKAVMQDQSARYEQTNLPLSSGLDDDCFCCCSHIVPATQFALSITESSVPAETLVAIADPATAPQSLFHPPKS